MPVIRLTSKNRQIFINRIEKLNAETPRKWGALDCIGVLRHMRLILEVSLAEKEVPDMSSLFLKTVGRVVAFHTPLPWPKGKIKVPKEYTPAPEGDFDTEKAQLLEAVGRFLEAAEAEPGKKTIHPGFGLVTLDYWRHVHGKHMDHHFRQFGV